MRRIFAWVAQGETATTIVKRLYDERVPTSRERGIENPRCIWLAEQIHSILTNEQYLGTYIAGRTRVAEIGSSKIVQVPRGEWVVIPNHHPAIVDKALFDAVSARKKAPNRKRESGVNRKRNNAKHALHGKVFCSCCGRKMEFGDAAIPVYRCTFTRNAEREACHKLRVPASDIEAASYPATITQRQKRGWTRTTHTQTSVHLKRTRCHAKRNQQYKQSSPKSSLIQMY